LEELLEKIRNDEEFNYITVDTWTLLDISKCKRT